MRRRVAFNRLLWRISYKTAKNRARIFRVGEAGPEPLKELRQQNQGVPAWAVLFVLSEWVAILVVLL